MYIQQVTVYIIFAYLWEYTSAQISTKILNTYKYQFGASDISGTAESLKSVHIVHKAILGFESNL